VATTSFLTKPPYRPDCDESGKLWTRGLGNQKLDYYGASYGTYLGQTYATIFPDRVGRMVLDGNVGPKNVWYDAQLAQDVAFDKNMDYYFGWIAKYDGPYHLGNTQAKVRTFFYDLVDRPAKTAVTFKDPQSGSVAAVGPDELTDVIQTGARS
jgi:pimeloyl-ACP methyl ester carboxylesterase